MKVYVERFPSLFPLYRKTFVSILYRTVNICAQPFHIFMYTYYNFNFKNCSRQICIIYRYTSCPIHPLVLVPISLIETLLIQMAIDHNALVLPAYTSCTYRLSNLISSKFKIIYQKFQWSHILYNKICSIVIIIIINCIYNYYVYAIVVAVVIFAFSVM